MQQTMTQFATYSSDIPRELLEQETLTVLGLKVFNTQTFFPAGTIPPSIRWYVTYGYGDGEFISRHFDSNGKLRCRTSANPAREHSSLFDAITSTIDRIELALAYSEAEKILLDRFALIGYWP